ncbi:F-box/LRR-repeat protein At3g59200-like [Carex rostrata]
MLEFCMPDVYMEIVEHDRISSLPIEVLTHILSFLSTKEAIYTCVLSKAWRKIWSTMPILNFNSCEFLMDEQDGDEGRKSGARFERFVRGILDNGESTNLDIVHYSRQIHWSEALVSMEWLDHVALLMPRVIHIDIDGNFYEVDLPDLIFSCASLQRLVMKFCHDCLRPVIKPTSIYLPSLKVLRLNCVELLDDFAQMLFMGCPSLERLYLSFCALCFSSISSMKLKKLRLYACDQYEEIQISCPDLVSLFITCGAEDNFLGISLNDMTSLVNATVKLYYYGDEMLVLNIFGGLSKITNLKLRLVYPNLKVRILFCQPYKIDMTHLFSLFVVVRNKKMICNRITFSCLT